MNNTGIIVKHFYKVPFGQELPFAGRYLKATGHLPGAIYFVTANGKTVSLPNSAAERLAKTTEHSQVTSPKAFI